MKSQNATKGTKIFNFWRSYNCRVPKLIADWMHVLDKRVAFMCYKIDIYGYKTFAFNVGVYVRLVTLCLTKQHNRIHFTIILCYFGIETYTLRMHGNEAEPIGGKWDSITELFHRTWGDRRHLGCKRCFEQTDSQTVRKAFILLMLREFQRRGQFIYSLY